MADVKTGLLDGKVFKGEIGLKNKDWRDQETISFEGGKFHSHACDQYEFTHPEYRAEVQGNVTLFDAESLNRNGERMEWGGAIRGDTLEAVGLHIKDGKTENEYWVKLKLAIAKAA